MINFIGIGATKAGTTWLFDRLRDLNEFRLTPIKELHYFDRDKEYYMSPDYAEITNFKNRAFFNRRWYIRFLKDIGRTIFQYSSLYDFKFVMKWHTSNYSDKMYASMFPNSDQKISGEITPSYSFLKLKDIQRIYKINNDLKLILLVRDPIERAWSHIRYRKPSILGSIDEIKSFIDSEEQSFRGDYLQTIENYSKVFPSKSILICFFDAIILNPKKLLKEVVVFLNGNARNVEDLYTLNNKSNVSKSMKMPPEVYLYLKEKYKEDIGRMSNLFGGYSTKWQNKHYGTNQEINKISFSLHLQDLNNT
jgi:hypothetical protein